MHVMGETLLALTADASMDEELCCAGMTSRPAITHSRRRATCEAFLSVANSYRCSTVTSAVFAKTCAAHR